MTPRRWRTALLIGLAIVAAAAIWIALARSDHANRLLLAPMIGGLDLCMIEPVNRAAEHDAHMKQDCRRTDGSAAARVDATLTDIGPRFSADDGRYELGYTLNVPLLRLLRRQGNDWRVDPELVARFVRTIGNSERSVVLYLFATHFSVDAPIEAEIARDVRSLAVTPSGPLSIDTYHGLDVYPWSVATTDNEITRRRLQAIDAVIEGVCSLSWWQRRKIKAVTLLGEVHHLFPGFEAGMGFASPYQVSDYSPVSTEGFRAFLAQQFKTVQALNRQLGSHFAAFTDIEPPGKDIRREPLKHFWEHIDSFAHGVLPINGWARAKGASPAAPPLSIRVYVNGKLAGRVSASLGRQDVLAAHPEFGTADVGWRFDLPFVPLAHGVHRIDVVAETTAGTLVKLGTRRFAFVDRAQSPAEPVAAAELPPLAAADASIVGSVDTPDDLSSVFFNPLVPLWHEFREQQVAHYLSFIARRLKGTCLSGTDTYVHQIAPFTNPSWDATKYAVGASLRPIAGLNLGISLYGESAYGASFLDWYSGQPGHQRYGVTEFHPLRGMDAAELGQTFDRHRAHGARFLTFFVDGQPRRPVPKTQSVFVYTTFNPDISAFGSDRLFASVRALMND